MRVAVLSMPGREETTTLTLVQLERANPGIPIWVHRTSERPAVPVFRRMLETFGGDDLLFLEDDVITCRNFFLYVKRAAPPTVVSYFQGPQGFPIGQPLPATGFHFSQAVWLPRALIPRLLTAPQRQHDGGQDDELGYMLDAIGEPIVYGPPLVQHVGATSIAWQGMTLDRRTAPDFVGEDFDSLTL